jgi:hypothetical protein
VLADGELAQEGATFALDAGQLEPQSILPLARSRLERDWSGR